MKYLLGLDNGGTMIKAAVFDEKGNQIAAASRQSGIIAPKPHFAERPMGEIWQANAAAVRDVLKAPGIGGEDIAGVGISGHGKGLYLLGKNGEEIYSGIASTDSRAVAYEKEFYEKGIAAKVYEKTFQKVMACQPVCLLRWMKDNERGVYDKIGSVFSVKDYIRYKLTGEIYAELTDVSGTSLLNLQTRSYDKELLECFGIADIYGKLPPVCGSAEVCGYITKAAAEETGLKEGTPVCGGMFDIDACALGAGITDGKSICVIGGTWSINEYISKTPVKDGSVSMVSCYCIPGYYLMEESSPTSAGNLDWFVRMFLEGELHRFGGAGDAFYAWLNGEVSRARADHGVLFYPFLFDSNEGHGINASLKNLTAANTKGEILRAVYEGVVFSHKKHIDNLLAGRDAPVSVRLAGGVAKSDVWAQMFADAIGIKTETVPDREQGCFGAALAAGVAAGVYADYDNAVRETARECKIYYPDPAMHEVYEKKYAQYRANIG